MNETKRTDKIGCCPTMIEIQQDRKAVNQMFDIQYQTNDYNKDMTWYDNKGERMAAPNIEPGYYLMCEGAFGGWFIQGRILFCPWCGVKIKQ